MNVVWVCDRGRRDSHGEIPRGRMGAQGDPRQLYLVCMVGESRLNHRTSLDVLCDGRPGYVLTNLTKVILDANTELRDTWTNMTPMVRFGRLLMSLGHC